MPFFICAGVLFLFSLKFYGAANGADSLKSVKGLGSGVITTAVFALPRRRFQLRRRAHREERLIKKEKAASPEAVFICFGSPSL
jgi:hypothetical protein